MKNDLLVADEKRNFRKRMGWALAILGSAAVGFGAGGLFASSASHKPVSLSAAQKIVHRLTHGEAKAIRVFSGPEGLTGVVLSGTNGPVVSWITNSRSAVIVGGVVDTQTNKNLTLQAMATYLTPNGVAASPATPSPHTEAFQSAPKAPSPEAVSDDSVGSGKSSGDGERWLKALPKAVASGAVYSLTPPGMTGGKTLYAFVDPNCIFCHRLFQYYENHKSQFAQEGVRLVLVPVAILKQSSINKAAEIVQKGWPAYLKDEQNFNEATEEGGISGISGPALVHYAQIVKTDTDWLANLSKANGTGEGTPFLVWKAGNGMYYYLDGYPTGRGFQSLFRSMQSGWKPK